VPCTTPSGEHQNDFTPTPTHLGALHTTAPAHTSSLVSDHTRVSHARILWRREMEMEVPRSAGALCCRVSGKHQAAYAAVWEVPWNIERGLIFVLNIYTHGHGTTELTDTDH